MTSATFRGPILAPVDLSSNSVPSVCWALREAALRAVPLLILHVAHDPPEDPGSYMKALAKSSDSARPSLVPLADAADEIMEQFLAYLEAHHQGLLAATEWKSRVVEGLPGPRILEVAEEIDASLVVVGSHGRGGLSELILGSIAEQVVHGATTPVVVVKDRVEWR